MADDQRRASAADRTTGGDERSASDVERSSGGDERPASDDERQADADEPPASGEPADATEANAEDAASSGPGGREVVVPLRLYKTVTVFSTLLAVVCILAGFVLLDRGTQRATASPEEVSLPVVALGLALIVGGSAVYAFSTRFRTEGMGKPKDDTAEESNDG